MDPLLDENNIGNEEDAITTSMLEAQNEADLQVDKVELESLAAAESSNGKENDILPPVPKLLQLSQDKLIEKTNDLKEKGNQLDLLLLKAESYSHFIKENQDRCRLALLDRPKKTVDVGDVDTPSKRKKLKTSTVASPSSSSDATNSGFAQPSNLAGGQLMKHQLEGLQWLLSLWENGLSGILADEMGLGKTIEVIALFAQLIQYQASGPYIVIAPLATITNWLKEFRRWLPQCPVLLYHGSKQERAELRRRHMSPAHTTGLHTASARPANPYAKAGTAASVPDVLADNPNVFPVVITSFEIAMIDRPFLERFTWKFMVLDEGHRIKNRGCRLVRELKAIPCVTRLLLSGTPIQNTLEELWSLLNFVNPLIFDSLELFQSWFGFRNIGTETKVEDILGNEQHERVVSKLHEILRPFLLRRLKRDVFTAAEMPLKREVVVYCRMSPLQRQYYALAGAGKLREALAEANVEGTENAKMGNPLMQLRKVCNHPFIFGEPRDESGQFLGDAHPELLVAASGKLQVLDRMLAVFRRERRKVLVFSQMTRLMNILQDYCDHKGYPSCRIDGSTDLHERQRAIDRFNDPSSDKFVFLLSTRAGGLGINLTAADTVVLFDSDWNPTADMQAQDRAHRIGQKSDVAVYRLLTTNSVEIMMMERQISKKKLERLTIQGGDFKRAGERSDASGGGLTLGKLRKLLEDDVNLSRRDGRGGGSSSDALGQGRSVDVEISDVELELITNRRKLFATFEVQTATATGTVTKDEQTEAENVDSERGGFDDSVVPLEGSMYDIISLEQFTMQAVA